MANSTLAAIRTKVRRLTRSPSPAQLTDSDIDEYVNTFILYDFPENLRLFSLRKNFVFYCSPNVQEYETTTSTVSDPLYNFENKYITIHEPVYIDGFKAYYTQDRTEFYSKFPFNNSIQSIGTGDGATTNFSGTLSSIPILGNRNVLFSSIDSAGNGLALRDTTTVGVNGALTDGGAGGSGNINYVTGAYSLIFSSAPGSGENIEVHTVPYAASRPTSMLYFDNKFILRPVPDKPYKIEMEVYQRPTELDTLLGTAKPDLEQWWQYVAYGAAKKVLEDRSDPDGVQMIMPEFKNQEKLVLRRTIVQQSNERVATIYSAQAGLGSHSDDFRF